MSINCLTKKKETKKKIGISKANYSKDLNKPAYIKTCFLWYSLDKQ